VKGDTGGVGAFSLGFSRSEFVLFEFFSLVWGLKLVGKFTEVEQLLDGKTIAAGAAKEGVVSSLSDKNPFFA